MKSQKIIIVAMVVIVLCALATEIQAADSIDLPDRIQITKDNDVSASMLSKLFGTEWQAIAGGFASDAAGGAGKFAGAFVLCLSIINTVAMFFISAMVLYTWGLAAVETAHVGKLGGTAYGNMWLPLRHITAFSITVPVSAGGLSLLQCAIIAVVSLSINLANVTWDKVGGYLITHAQQGVIDNVPPFIEEESMALIRPMFRASVAQALAMRDGLLEVKEQDFPSNTTSKNSYKRITSVASGTYAVVEEPLEGRISVYIMPHHSMEFGSLGSVSFPYPLVKIKNGSISMPTEKEELEQYQAMVGIARARAKAVVQMWADINLAAHNYLHDMKVTSYQGSLPQAKSGLQIARDYRDSVMSETTNQLKTLRSQTQVIKMLEEAIDSDGTQSKLGWASAGLMPFTFARAQSRLDAISFGEGAIYSNIEDAEKLRLNYTINPLDDVAYKEAYAWASKNLLEDRIYNPVSKEGDGAGLVNRLIAGYFVDTLSNEGILSTTLARLKQADPMVVLSDFGGKCYTTAAAAAAISVGSAALSWIPKFGSALSAISTNPFLVMGMSILWAVGVTLKFVLPFTVVVMWLWALIKWSATVVYVLTGAPLWAVAHMAPEGSGFAGESAREGYFTLLDLALRPVLLVIGIIASMSLWAVLTELYLTLIAKFINSYSSNGGNGVIGEITLSCIVMIIFAGAYTKVFSLCINAGPALVMKMRGRGGATLDAGDDDGSHLTAVAGLATAKGASMIGSAAGAVNSASQGAKGIFDKNKDKDGVNKGKDSDNKSRGTDTTPTIAAKEE